MKIIDRVEGFLKANKVYRNSDKRLLLDYWQKQGLTLTPQQRKIFMDKCTTPESITRARRALAPNYPADQYVENERFNKFEQHKNQQAISWLED